MRNQPKSKTAKNTARRGTATPTKVREPEHKQAIVNTGTSKKNNDSAQILKKGQSVKVTDARNVSKNLFELNKSRKIEKKNTARKGNAEYHNFYKHHFNRLKESHPKWSNKQITAITILLWKKNKNSTKQKSQAEVRELCENIINGKEGFKDSKLKLGYPESQIEEMWKRLPIEAKRKWQTEGLGSSNKKQKEFESIIFRCSEEAQNNKFNFLHKV